MSAPTPAYRILDTIKNKKSKGLTLEAEALSGGLKKGMEVRLQPEGQDIRIKDATCVSGTKYILKIKGAAVKSFTGRDWLFPHNANSFSSRNIPVILAKDFPSDEFNDGWILTTRGERNRVSVLERITKRFLILQSSSPISLIPGENMQISRGREISLKGRVCFKLSPDQRKAETSKKKLSQLAEKTDVLIKDILNIQLRQDGIIFKPSGIELQTEETVSTGDLLLTQSFNEKIMKIVTPLISKQGGCRKEDLQSATRIPKFQFNPFIQALEQKEKVFIESGYILYAGDKKGEGLSPMASQILSEIENRGLKGVKITSLKSRGKADAIQDLARMKKVKSDGSWAIGKEAFKELSLKITESGAPPYSPGSLAEEWELPRGVIYAVLNIMDNEN